MEQTKDTIGNLSIPMDIPGLFMCTSQVSSPLVFGGSVLVSVLLCLAHRCRSGFLSVVSFFVRVADVLRTQLRLQLEEGRAGERFALDGHNIGHSNVSTKRGIFFLAMMMGCNAPEIRGQAAVSHDDERIIAVFPPQDALALRGDLRVQVVLGEEGIGTIPHVRIVGDDHVWTPNCWLDEREQWVTCHPAQDLPRDQVFDIKVGMYDQDPLMVSVTSEFPKDIPGYLINPNATVTRFGENASTAERLGDIFRESEHRALVIIDEYDGQAGDYTLLAGPVDINENNDKASIRSPGFTFVKHVVVHEDGTFNSVKENVFLPIFMYTDFVQVLIQNCQISGKIENQSISNLTIKGDIPAISLVKLAEPLGLLSDFALNNIAMDVDLDQDGEFDAASFTLVSNAPQIALSQY